MISSPNTFVPRWKILILRPLVVCGVMAVIALVAGWFNFVTASNIMFGIFIVTINVGWIYLSKLYKEARRREKHEDGETEDQKDYKKRTDIAYAILACSVWALLSSFLFVLLIR